MRMTNSHLVNTFPTAAEVEVALTTCRLLAEIAVPIDAFVATANDMNRSNRQPDPQLTRRTLLGERLPHGLRKGKRTSKCQWVG